MQEFLNMGGYGGYVWPAYLVSAAVLIALAISIWRRGKSLSRQVKEIGAEATRDPEARPLIKKKGGAAP